MPPRIKGQKMSWKVIQTLKKNAITQSGIHVPGPLHKICVVKILSQETEKLRI